MALIQRDVIQQNGQAGSNQKLTFTGLPFEVEPEGLCHQTPAGSPTLPPRCCLAGDRRSVVCQHSQRLMVRPYGRHAFVVEPVSHDLEPHRPNAVLGDDRPSRGRLRSGW